MSTVNSTGLLAKFQQALEVSYSVGSNVDDVVASTKSLKLLDETNIIVVSTIDYLPNLVYYSSNGMIYFITDLGIFTVSSNNRWLTLDGRVLRQDTTFNQVWAWGSGGNGQLGDNTTVSKSSPVSVLGNFTDWSQVSAGCLHSLAVRTNGTAWAWGCNSVGQLGDGTTVSKLSPVSVVGGFCDWCQVAAGEFHSLGVRTNGTAWAWGGNSCGRLGDGTTVGKSSPVSVVGGFVDWCQVSAGASHSLGVRTNGTAWAWGDGALGRLGNNCTTAGSSPVSVIGGFCDWCQVAAGDQHSLGVRTDGTAWAWGSNTSSQLGINTSGNRSSPVSVAGGFVNWCQVAAGRLHSLGVRTNGTAWAWGANGAEGRLGNADIAAKDSPVSVVGGFTDWCQVSAGCQHSLGLRTNGTAWAWGLNICGTLGDGTTVNKSSPISVVGGFTDWCQVSAGGSHSLGVVSI